MTTLDSILESNGFFDGCPAPLWKIKVNDEQYNSLKEYLVYRYSVDGNFNGCPKEAALLFSEWWKRDPGDSRETGEQYYKAVYASLGLPENANAAKNLYENAKRIFNHSDSAHIPGAKLVSTKKGNAWIYSLFFQGGIPLGRAASGQKWGEKWKNIIKKFVRKNIDLEDLPGAQVAKKTLRDYKDVLVAASRNKVPENMPFDCDAEHPWYKLVTNLIDIGDKERASRPFHIEWRLLRRGREFSIHGVVSGPSELNGRFLDEHPELKENDTIQLELFSGEECVDTIAAYEKMGDSSYRTYHLVNFTFNYDGESRMSLRIPGMENPILTDFLDMSAPHSFFQSPNGQYYEKGSRFGERMSIISFDDTWDTDGELGNRSAKVDCQFNGKPFHQLVCNVTDDSSVEFILKKKDNTELFVKFGSDHIPSRTLVEANRKYNPLVVEDLYDFSDITRQTPTGLEGQATVIKVSEDDDEGDIAPAQDVRFRSNNTTGWLSKPILGRVQCTVVSKDDGEINYALPEKGLLSVGPSFHIEPSEHRPEECSYWISWDDGEVYSADGMALKDDRGRFVVRKEAHKDVFPLNCIPKEGEPFVIHVKTQYREFTIYTPSGEKLHTYETIPWAEIKNYRYLLYGNDKLRFKQADNLSESKKVSTSRNREPGELPPEGSLGLILTAEVLSKFTDYAEKGVMFGVGNLDIMVQRYPLKLVHNQQTNTFSVVMKDISEASNDYITEARQKILGRFKGHLLFFNTDGDLIHDVQRDEDGLYRVPDVDGKVIVICNQKGYLRPAVIENGSVRSVRSAEEYTESLENSSLEDQCWNTVLMFLNIGLMNDIPLVELPWIRSVITNPGLFFALYCRQYILSGDDPDTLGRTESLMNMAIKAYRVPVAETPDMFERTCNPECFPEQYAKWKAETGIDDFKIFLYSIEANVQQLIIRAQQAMNNYC